VHTATDLPLSAYGSGASAFAGVVDNNEVFFKLARAVYVR
jgi:alkaline phosphatase